MSYKLSEFMETALKWRHKIHHKSWSRIVFNHAELYTIPPQKPLSFDEK